MQTNAKITTFAVHFFLSMLEVLIYAFLLSISPLGEGRAGIPYAILNDVPPVLAFVVGLTGNLLVFPMLMWLIDTFSQKLWPHRRYRQSVIHFSRRAKKGVGSKVKKYGFWGLMVFVMIPLPGTGAYMGAIAAYALKIERRKAFLATSLGVFISCLVMAVGSHFGNLGWKSL